jgi:hypothetical protein
MSNRNNGINGTVVVGSGNMVAGGTYVITGASQVGLGVPLDTAIQPGDKITIIGSPTNTGGFSIGTNTSQSIYYKGVASTAGTSHGWKTPTTGAGGTIVEIFYVSTYTFIITTLNGTLTSF